MYEQYIPVPSSEYVKPLDSITEVSASLVKLASRPLTLALHVLGFLLNSVTYLLLSALLFLPTVGLAIVAPYSNVSKGANTLFKYSAAQVFVGAGMAVLALFAAVASLALNPICLLVRAGHMVFERVNEASHEVFGCKIG